VVLGKEFEMSLYTSASGREVNHLSYSAISDYDYCPELFRLSRIEGYVDKEKRAAFSFGNCVESAIQFFHENGLKAGEGIDEFKRLWLKWKDIPLVYSDQEGSWFDLLNMGASLLRLYEVRLPDLPIKNPKFQLNYKKPLWPGTELADLEFTSFIDILSTLEDGGRIIVDVKTAKSPLPDIPGILALDPQLKDYAWATGIKEVAFLWLVKGRPSFKHGDTISLLEDAGNFKAGQELVVAKFTSPKDAVVVSEGVKASPAVPWLLLAGTTEVVRKMDEELEKISGKGSKERTEALYAEYAADGRLVYASQDGVSKTRLQFLEATIPDKDIPEAGQFIGHRMLQIKSSVESNFFPKTGGLRFPNQKCPSCRMRGLCLGRQDLVDQLLVKIGPKVQEDDWLKELESEVE
jgi:hypothetical protein